MAINIAVTDANKDGIGINFSTYLTNFASTYHSAGYGGFNQPDPNDSFKGRGYVTKNTEADAGGTSVIFASTSYFTYDLSTHVITGNLKSITFGGNTAYNAVSETYTNSSDIVISGFSNHATSTKDGQIMGDVMDAHTATLLKFLAANSINFKGSTGTDTFTSFGNNDVLNGGAGNDRLYGAAGNDTLVGGTGNDRLYGDGGNDKLQGGDGNDTVFGGASADRIYGDAGNDKLYGDTSNDTLNGGLGNDSIYGGTGNDTILGGEGNDRLEGGTGIDKLSGGNGADRLDSGDSNDALIGNAGNDYLYGGAGNDRINGGIGNDRLTGDAGADTFYFVKNDGMDRILDFDQGATGKDVIEFAHGLFKDYAAVVAASTDTSAGVQISYSGGKLLLVDVQLTNLHASDFHLL